MVFAPLSLEQGLQIRVSECLKQGILFAIPTLMEDGRGDYFAARIAVQTNVNTHAWLKHAVFGEERFPNIT